MKSLIYLFTLITFTFGILTNNTNGQESEKSDKGPKLYNGYVILENGEKLPGYIEMLCPVINQVKVKISSLDKKEEKTFKSQELKEYAFQFEEWNHTTRKYNLKWVKYVNKEVGRSAVPFGSKSTLVLQEQAGAIGCYSFFYQSNADVDFPIKNLIYIEKKSSQSGLVVVDQDNYKEILRDMVHDYVELHSKVGTSQYTFAHLNKIISEYNAYMEEFGEENVLTSVN